MNRKSRRRAAKLGQAPDISKVRDAVRLELDQAVIDAAFPRSILVYEPDGTETLIGEGPIGAIMPRAMLEKIKALPEVKRAAEPFLFGGIEFEERRG